VVQVDDFTPQQLMNAANGGNPSLAESEQPVGEVVKKKAVRKKVIKKTSVKIASAKKASVKKDTGQK
jgi:hypothetical protein